MNRLAITMGFVALGLLTLASPLLGQVVKEWDGGGIDNNFNTPENWYNLEAQYDNLVPVAGDTAAISNGGTALVNQDNTVANFYLGGADASNGYAEMTAGTMNITSAFHVGYNTTSQGGLNLSGGTINVIGEFSLAQLGNGTDITKASIGIVRQTGGSLLQSTAVTAWNRIARYDGNYALYELSGGDLQLANGYFGGESLGDGDGLGVGYLNQSGGTFTINGGDTKGLRLSNSSGSVGIYNLTGGTGRVMTGGVNVAANGGNSPLGVINIGGTGQFTIDYQGVVTETGADIGFLRVGVKSTAGKLSDGVVNLATGGTLTAPLIYAGNGVDDTTVGNASLNFHGGTLVTNADQANYLRLMDAYVYSEGAKIDTAGHNVTINRALLAPSGYGVQSIELAGFGGGGSGYDGPPAVRITGGSGTGATALATVADGEVTGITVTNPGSGYQQGDTLTVKVWGGGASLSASDPTVTLGTYATSGGLQKLGLGTLTLAGANTYTGATSVQAGCLDIDGSITSNVTVNAAAALSGVGTITGNVDLNGTLAVGYDSDADTVDLLTVVGGLDLTGSTLSFSDAGSGTLVSGTYVLAAYNSLVGTPASTLGLLSGWSIDYAYDYSGGANNSIALIVNSLPPIPGDTDNNRIVDAVDAQVLATHWGQTVTGGYEVGNFNGDTVVNAADAAILAANWGSHAEGAAAVPEPGIAVLLLAGGLAMVARRRPRR